MNKVEFPHILEDEPIEDEEEILEFYEWDERFQKISEEVLDVDRWSIAYRMVCRNRSDNTYWSLIYIRGATEYQEVELNLNVQQVEPYEKTTTAYRVVS